MKLNKTIGLLIFLTLLGLTGSIFLLRNKSSKNNSNILEDQESEYNLSRNQGEEIVPPNEDDLNQYDNKPEEKEIDEELLITEEEFNELLTGDIKTKEKTIPEELKGVLFEKLKSFCNPEDTGFLEGDIIEGEVANIDEDEVEEFIVTPGIICGLVFRGASGNGPFYVYDELASGWELIGELDGNNFAITNNITNGYYDINTNYHMSAGSGTVTTYQFREEKSSFDFTYKPTVEQEYNFEDKETK